ncbi:ATP-binding protein [Acaryochloris marina]|uniref:histidine kinase n=1 Tax=Acaryochloris marina (strain MBIC 11017) TaxID=329726 RepID=B0C7V5_ACAM1|nr:ATP-binding protein [Acaryochloris marina]ABW26496.1 two-component sensor histidine kinase [Acaryochloris marina MBIC11017]BDM81305.1 hypothetical protein AM10699_41720 [Acaryochloris marina MBIC10699]
MVSFLKKRLFAPLYVSLTVLILLLLTQEGLSLVVNIQKQRNVNRITQTFKIKRESERLLRAALEEKVALRGYLLNKDKEFLQQYRDGRTAFSTSLDRLSNLLQDDPSLKDNLGDIYTFHSQWEDQFVQPVLSGSFELEDLSQLGSLDTLRGTIDGILLYEKGLLNAQNRRLAHLEWLNQLSFVLSGLSIGVITIGSVGNFGLLRRRMVSPIQHLMKVGQAWKTGQLEVQITHTSEDEMGQLAIILNDMAQDIRNRQEKIQQRNQQLEDLIRTFSHDLRTPLLANRSTLHAMVGGAFGDVSDSFKEILGESQDANDNLIKLVETLLDISRYEAEGSRILNRERLNWHKICDRVTLWIQQSTQDRCHLKTDIKSNLPDAIGDAIEIQRVLLNLVENAVRLSDQGKTIRIEVLSSQPSQVQVAVRDHGPGLKEKDAKHLFRRFSQGTGRQGRAGLGLYLCRQIIEAHGGKIWVESTIGQGATFWFSLPIEASPSLNGTA